MPTGRDYNEAVHLIMICTQLIVFDFGRSLSTPYWEEIKGKALTSFFVVFTTERQKLAAFTPTVRYWAYGVTVAVLIVLT